MTKKEILNWIEGKIVTYGNSTNQYELGYIDAINILKEKLQQLPDDEWIRFDEKMPTDEDFTNDKILNGKSILLCNENHFMVEEKSLFEENGAGEFTHWKRIKLPSKSLPTKAEIMEQFNISEEQLKEIVK